MISDFTKKLLFFYLSCKKSLLSDRACINYSCNCNYAG